MIIHWAGKDSDVIVALTRDIKPTSRSSSNIYISNNYGSTYSRKSLKINATTNATFEKFYNSPSFNSHVRLHHIFINPVSTPKIAGWQLFINYFWVPQVDCFKGWFYFWNERHVYHFCLLSYLSMLFMRYFWQSLCSMTAVELSFQVIHIGLLDNMK